MRPAGKAREARIWPICERRATQPGETQRRSNADGLAPRAAKGERPFDSRPDEPLAPFDKLREPRALSRGSGQARGERVRRTEVLRHVQRRGGRAGGHAAGRPLEPGRSASVCKNASQGPESAWGDGVATLGRRSGAPRIRRPAPRRCVLPACVSGDARRHALPRRLDCRWGQTRRILVTGRTSVEPRRV